MLDSGMSEQDMVNQEFEELYPGKVERTQIAYNAKVCFTSIAAVGACPRKPRCFQTDAVLRVGQRLQHMGNLCYL